MKGKLTNFVELDNKGICAQLGQRSLAGLAVRAVGFAENGCCSHPLVLAYPQRGKGGANLPTGFSSMMLSTFCLAAAETIMGCEAPKNRRNIEAILIECVVEENPAGLSSEPDVKGYIYICTLDDEWRTLVMKEKTLTGYLELAKMTKPGRGRVLLEFRIYLDYFDRRSVIQLSDSIQRVGHAWRLNFSTICARASEVGSGHVIKKLPIT